MTRRKKTRSLADRLNIKTGRKKDLVRRLQEQRKQGHKPPLSPHALKRKKQRKEQAARKLERLQRQEQS